MDFDITEEQNLLKSSARDFLSKECTAEHVRAMLDDELGYSRELWGKMAELGWMGITLPADYDGVEGSFLDLILLQEEMGRFLLPSPFLPTMLAGRAINAIGNDDQKKLLLPAIAGGDLIMVLALTETIGGGETSGSSLKAVRDGSNIALTGTISFVPYAHAADYLLCSAQTADKSGSEEGTSLFLVATKTVGVQITPLKTTTGDKLCEVTFDKVKVSEADILGNIGNGWEALKNIVSEGAIAECGSIIGGAGWVLETAVDYADHRQQFGRPIGSFQAIQHKCTDMLIAVDGASLITYHAAWSVSDSNVDHHEAASKAKTWCSDIYSRVANEGIQVLGGMGFTQEHDMQLYFRRSRASELVFGDSHYHRDRMLQQLNL